MNRVFKQIGEFFIDDAKMIVLAGFLLSFLSANGLPDFSLIQSLAILGFGFGFALFGYGLGLLNQKKQNQKEA